MENCELVKSSSARKITKDQSVSKASSNRINNGSNTHTMG